MRCLPFKYRIIHLEFFSRFEYHGLDLKVTGIRNCFDNCLDPGQQTIPNVSITIRNVSCH